METSSSTLPALRAFENCTGFPTLLSSMAQGQDMYGNQIVFLQQYNGDLWQLASTTGLTFLETGVQSIIQSYGGNGVLGPLVVQNGQVQNYSPDAGAFENCNGFPTNVVSMSQGQDSYGNQVAFFQSADGDLWQLAQTTGLTLLETGVQSMIQSYGGNGVLGPLVVQNGQVQSYSPSAGAFENCNGFPTNVVTMAQGQDAYGNQVVYFLGSDGSLWQELASATGLSKIATGVSDVYQGATQAVVYYAVGADLDALAPGAAPGADVVATDVAAIAIGADGDLYFENQSGPIYYVTPAASPTSPTLAANENITCGSAYGVFQPQNGDALDTINGPIGTPNSSYNILDSDGSTTWIETDDQGRPETAITKNSDGQDVQSTYVTYDSNGTATVTVTDYTTNTQTTITCDPTGQPISTMVGPTDSDDPTPDPPFQPIDGGYNGMPPTITGNYTLDVCSNTTAITGQPVSVTVWAVDALGNLVPNYTGTVSFSSSDQQAGLPANYGPGRKFCNTG